MRVPAGVREEPDVGQRGARAVLEAGTQRRAAAVRGEEAIAAEVCGFLVGLSTAGALRLVPPFSRGRSGAPIGASPSRESGTEVCWARMSAKRQVLLGELTPHTLSQGLSGFKTKVPPTAVALAESSSPTPQSLVELESCADVCLAQHGPTRPSNARCTAPSSA